MRKDSRIFVAGHRGLVGSAICRRLIAENYDQLLLRTRSSLDLTDPLAVNDFFERERPEYVFLAAARVGGILANSTYPADFIRINLAIQLNVIEAAHRYGVRKCLMLGSSCIYPKMASQPIKEEYLLTGTLEPTNDAYAIAKIAGIKLADAYRRQYGLLSVSLMPTNLYGPGDTFDPEQAHVIPALMNRFDLAVRSGDQEVVIWGSGTPRREFMHVDDLADAALFVMLNYDGADILNVGSGQEVTIAELAGLIAKITGFRGNVVFDSSKPDGTPRKLLDLTKLTALGWRAQIPLEQGLADTYRWYTEERGVEAVR